MEGNIRTAITTALTNLGISSVDFSIEHPGDLSHGDYATNVAMAAAKQAGSNPRALAEQIVSELRSQNIPYVATIDPAGPGFINFTLTREFFTEQMQHALSLKDAWGKSDALAGKKVMVEYTSPNLFKPLHIGNLMSNIVGESLARLFEYSGADVKRFNYPSDIGLTVAKGVWALKKNGGNPDDIDALGAAYREGNAAYEDDTNAKIEIESVNKILYLGEDEELNNLRARGIATSLAHLRTLCEVLGTSFDFEYFESESGSKGRALVLAHIEDGIFEESEGAVVFKGERFDLHTRVFINSAGLPTYEAKDLGLAAIKMEAYPFDLSVTTTAVEQDAYFKVIIRAIEEVFPKLRGKVVHVGYGFLTLTTGKMSSRKGNVITGESLITDMREKALKKIADRVLEGGDTEKSAIVDMIAVSAIKYMALRQSTSRNIVFDPEKSLSFEGDSGPYLQYTYARINSILEKAHREGVVSSTVNATNQIVEVEKILYRFPSVVLRAQKEYEPHYVATYLSELAGVFNTWYANEKIVDAGDEYSPYKVALASAVAQTIKNGLWVLGIKAPERM